MANEGHPKHTVDELLSSFVTKRVDEVVQKATQEHATTTKLPGLSDMLHGEGLVSVDPSGDLTEDGDE